MALVYPEGLPVPQTSTVTPKERRALSDADYPREAVAVERDRAQIEEITLPPMRADQLAIFWAWWRDDLIYGGAWFAATWPLPVGMVAAVRKFIGAPQREYFAPGFWRVTATCEVRGSGVFPAGGDALPTILFLDNFNGADETFLTDHTQDIRLNDSVWLNFGEGYVPVLDGAGHAGRLGDGHGLMFASVQFSYFDGDEEILVNVLSGWVFEFECTPLQNVSSDPGTQAYSVFTVSGYDGFVSVTFIPDSPSESARIEFEFTDSDLVSYSLPGGTSSYKVLIEDTGCTLYINNVVQEKVLGVQAPLSLREYTMQLGSETSVDTPPYPAASISSISITGTLA